MAADYYNAPNHASDMLNELGIDVNNIKTTFDPTSQPKQIGAEFNKAKASKYQQQQEKQQKEDIQIPRKLLEVSTINKNKVKSRQTQSKGRKKQSKRGTKKGKKKAQPQQGPKNKEQVQIGLQLDEVAEWGEKGTKINGQQEEEQFDDQEQQRQQQNTAEQQAIRKRLEEKLKKYENPGSSTQPKNTLGSLQSKAQEIKKKKQSQNMNQSTQQLFPSRQTGFKEQKVVEKQQEEQQESEDPWQKINEKTIKQKQVETQAFKNAEEMDLNKYYQNLKLELDDQAEENDEPSTGFFQALCSCLKPKKKSLTQLQRQIIGISKIQLSNKPEEVTLLKNIWTNLTNKKYLRYGEHWNQIGFQGRDPATDLRSTGILSLLHWDNFIKFDSQYCHKIFNFCVQFDLPLALTHIKITNLVTSAVKRRQLEGKSWTDFLQWYYAFCYYTFDHLMKEAKSPHQIGEIVQKSVERTGKEIQNAKKYFNTHIKSKR